MITSRRDTANIFNGCLAYLRNDLSAILPQGKELTSIGIKGIVGSETQYNVHNSPWDSAHSYFEIYFGNKYILPIAYSLMGRRDPTYKGSYLKSWEFFGRDEAGVWNILHSQSNKPFAQAEKRTFSLSVNKSFNAFKIQMIDTDSSGEWALCLGQIEVFGDIFKSSFNRCKCTKQASRRNNIVLISLIIYQTS